MEVLRTIGTDGTSERLEQSELALELNFERSVAVERLERSWKSPSVLSRPKGPYRRAGTIGTARSAARRVGWQKKFYKLGEAGWKVVSLDSRNGFEYKGVVDLVAVKGNNRSSDDLAIMLVDRAAIHA